MVGMVIAMLGVVIMMQVFSVAEANKRATTSGDDAQSNGAIALYNLQRDLRESGYGTNALNLLGCDVTLRSGVTVQSIAPVTINQVNADGTSRIPPGDPNTDTLLVVMGNSTGSPEGDLITQQPAANVYAMATPSSFQVSEWIVVEPQSRPSPCALTMEQVLSKPSGTNNITVTTGVTGFTNPVAYNLGPAPRMLAYAVRNSALTVCDYTAKNCGDVTKKDDATVWVPIASNIVSLRAQYGRDVSAPTMNATVDLYDQTTPTTACGWARVSAVRIALVARSAEYVKGDAVTAAAPVWAATGADNPAGSASAPIDLSLKPDGSANADWQHYRYRTFQTIIPLRNIVSLGVQPGC